jgi:hypothetical protein
VRGVALCLARILGSRVGVSIVSDSIEIYDGSTADLVILGHCHSHLAKIAELYRGVLFDYIWGNGIVAGLFFKWG